MVELVDTLDLKSNDHCGRAGSSPAPGTLLIHKVLKINFFRAFVFIWGNREGNNLFFMLKLQIAPIY